MLEIAKPPAMKNDITDLLTELDNSFIYLGSHDTYENSPRVVVPKRVEEMGLIEPPEPMHLGMSPVEPTSQASKEQSETAQASRKATDTIPYILLARFDGWLRNPTNDLKYGGSTTLQENRSVELGVYFVPELRKEGGRYTPIAPNPHRLATNETLTFWIRPSEWRKKNHLYMIREKYAQPLLEVFKIDPEDIPVAERTGRDHTQSADASTHEVDKRNGDAVEVTEPRDENLQSDGGWREPVAHSDEFDEGDSPPLLEEIPAETIDDFEQWWQRGYAIDVVHNKATKVLIIEDLTGVSEQVAQVLSALETIQDTYPDSLELSEGEFEDIVRAILSTLIADGDLVVEEFKKDILAQKSDLSEHNTMEALLEYLIPTLEDSGVVDWSNKKYWWESVVSLDVRPTAVYAALDLTDAEENGSPPSRKKITGNESRRQITEEDPELRYANIEINRMAAALGMSQAIRDIATDIYHGALENDLIASHTPNGVAAAALYGASREENVAMSINEVSEISSVEHTKVGRAFRSLDQNLDFEFEPPDPRQFVPRFCSELGLSEQVQDKALKILQTVEETDLPAGKSPTGIAAAAVYAAALLCGEARTQTEVAEASDVSVETIQTLYQEQFDAVT